MKVYLFYFILFVLLFRGQIGNSLSPRVPKSVLRISTQFQTKIVELKFIKGDRKIFFSGLTPDCMSWLGLET
jgi:hypothetical protein